MPDSPRQPSRLKLAARLWRDFLGRYWRLIAALAPLVVLVAACASGYVAIVRYAGQLLERADLRVVYQIPIWVIAVAGLRAVSMFGQAILTSDIANRVLRDLQNAMFETLLRADYARVAGDRTGRFVSRFTNDINVIADSIVRSVSSVLRDALTLAGTLAMMLWIDWVLALFVVVLFALAGPQLAAIGNRARRDTRTAQAHMGDLTSLLTESFSSARFVRTYGLEGYEQKRAAEAFEIRRKMQMRLVRNRARSDPFLEVLGAIALAAVLAMAGWRIAKGESSVADMLAFIGAIATASASGRALGAYNTVLNEGLAALARVFELLDERPRITDRIGAPPLEITGARVRFEDVSFAYEDGGNAALSHFSLDVAPGETVALVGPSGAGKSTIFNLIARLFDVSAGRVLIDGQDARDVSLASLRASIALVSQDVTLFNDTVRANIAFGRPNASDSEIEAAAKAAAAHDFICALPQGYDTIVGERGGALSGGERQRVALARAFLRDAPILLLDEATSALDSESERRVQEALERLSAGRTTLVIAHRLATVRRADRIVAMENGRIVEIGGHDELIAHNGLYARLCRLQFAEA